MKSNHDKDFIPPYLCKAFKIIPVGMSENMEVLVDYVDDLVESQIEHITKMSRKPIKTRNKIDISDFKVKVAELFQTETHPRNAIVKQSSDQESKAENAIMTPTDFVKTIPIDVLEKEIRRRYLSNVVKGVITIGEDGTKVSIASMPWPRGMFEFEMRYVSEIPDIQVEKISDEKIKGGNNG